MAFAKSFSDPIIDSVTSVPLWNTRYFLTGLARVYEAPRLVAVAFGKTDAMVVLAGEAILLPSLSFCCFVVLAFPLTVVAWTDV